MPIHVVTVPCLSDNYAFVLGDDATGHAALVDAPEAGPINDVLAARGWQLTDVLLTHHHADHVDGLADLIGTANASVIGAKADAHRLPDLTQQVQDGEVIKVLGQDVQVIDVSGHTVGHVAFYMPGIHHAFTADSLMALGCGRLFEGSAAQMWDSLQKLRALPDDTIICSGHEYTATNAAFAITIDPQNAALQSRAAEITQLRRDGKSTVPSFLGLEKQTNPFLRADDEKISANLGLTYESPAEVFAEIRRRKDSF